MIVRRLPGWVLGVWLLSSAAAAAEFDGRAVLELEYLGEWYRYQGLLDLPLPEFDEVSLETARFSRDSWLPGNRLELNLAGGAGTSLETRAYSATGFNAERFFQELTGVLERKDDRGRWRLQGDGEFRESSESLAGHGEWRAGASVMREDAWGPAWTTRLEAGGLHSRTRGDTASFLLDYDRIDVRARVFREVTFGRRLEFSLRGRRKAVAEGLDGSYGEVRTAAGWSSGFGRTGATLEWTLRRYGPGDGDVGRDLQELRTDVRGRLVPGGSWWGQGQGRVVDYAGSDDLYYDYAEVEVFLSREQGGAPFLWVVGPKVQRLWDRSGGNRDYVDLRGRVEMQRSLGISGFLQAAVEAGHRDYAQADAEAVEIASLSASLLRTDYWTVDVFIVGNVPLARDLDLEILGNLGREFHPAEDEQIQVTLVTVGVSRGF